MNTRVHESYTTFEILINGEWKESIGDLMEALDRFKWYTENSTGYIVLNVRSITTLATQMVIR